MWGSSWAAWSGRREGTGASVKRALGGLQCSAALGDGCVTKNIVKLLVEAKRSRGKNKYWSGKRERAMGAQGRAAEMSWGERAWGPRGSETHSPSVRVKVQMDVYEKAGRILLLCMQLGKKEDKKEKEKCPGNLGKEHRPRSWAS